MTNQEEEDKQNENDQNDDREGDEEGNGDIYQHESKTAGQLYQLAY